MSLAGGIQGFQFDSGDSCSRRFWTEEFNLAAAFQQQLTLIAGDSARTPHIRGIVAPFPLPESRSIINASRLLRRCLMPMPGLFGLTRVAKPLTSEEGHRILERDRYRCQYCGLDGMAGFENSLVMTVDFVIPRAHKGRKHPTNLVAACRPCNVIKGRRFFGSFEEAKRYVLQRRAELQKEWQAKVVRLQSPSVSA